jgi:IMP dehydrogenase/GMP reductase
MRTFHNFIKRVIIENVAKLYRSHHKNEEICLLDIACGRGGDIFKYQSAGISYVFAFDRSEESITSINPFNEGAISRYNSSKSTLSVKIDFAVGDVELQAKVSRNYSLNYPLCSSPMDTVTESEMAICMALNGGIGIIHYIIVHLWTFLILPTRAGFIHANCSEEEQISMVEKVKGYENGFIMEPAVLSPNHNIRDLDILRNAKKISGVPVTIDGRMGSKLVGLISNRDTDFLADRSKSIAELMTPIDKLVTGLYPLSIEEANHILKVSNYNCCI